MRKKRGTRVAMLFQKRTVKASSRWGGCGNIKEIGGSQKSKYGMSSNARVRQSRWIYSRLVEYGTGQTLGNHSSAAMPAPFFGGLSRICSRMGQIWNRFAILLWGILEWTP